MAKDEGDAGEKFIHVNGAKIPVKEDHLTAKEIIELAGGNPDKDTLFRDDQQDELKVDQSVEVKDGMRFNMIPKKITYG